jgi:hypothetical protein
MRHQAETSLSDKTDGFEILNFVPSTDTVAIIAVLVSAYTWYKSWTIEERIRADSDERTKFDVIFGNPFIARLEVLESISMGIGHVVRTQPDSSKISENLSTIQTHEHSEWFFSLTSLLESYDAAPATALKSALSEYWDQASGLINEMNDAKTPARAMSIFRLLQSLIDGHLGLSRKLLIEHRAKVRGSAPPVFGNLFKCFRR